MVVMMRMVMQSDGGVIRSRRSDAHRSGIRREIPVITIAGIRNDAGRR